MKRILDYFDRAYVINLRDRIDRRLGVIREFARFGIEVPSSKIQFYAATHLPKLQVSPLQGHAGVSQVT
jgi:hypothetical protein